MKQYYEEVSAIQNYEIGQSYKIDKRVFHYSEATVALVLTYRLAAMRAAYLATNEMLTAVVNGAVGDKSLTLITTLFIGEGGVAGVVAENELKDAYIEIFPATGVNQFMWRKIIGNGPSIGANTIVYLDRPLNVVAVIGSQVGLHPQIYRSIAPMLSVTADYRVAAGVPPVPVPLATPFHWLQTYGPCWIAASVPGQPLATANYVDVYAYPDGCISSSLGVTIGTSISAQRVGHVLGAEAYGCNEIFLELDNS